MIVTDTDKNINAFGFSKDSSWNLEKKIHIIHTNLTTQI